MTTLLFAMPPVSALLHTSDPARAHECSNLPNLDARAPNSDAPHAPMPKSRAAVTKRRQATIVEAAAQAEIGEAAWDANKSEAEQAAAVR
eukprot:6181000-Pleurochrysis_carterae.AAC.2